MNAGRMVRAIIQLENNKNINYKNNIINEKLVEAVVSLNEQKVLSVRQAGSSSMLLTEVL